LSDFTKAEKSSDFTRAENWAEGVSDFGVWDIGQVTVSNFDWLSFTPLWSPSPVLETLYSLGEIRDVCILVDNN
jgi:hypothetical protein